MPHEVVLGSIYAALKTALAGAAPLAALISTKRIGGAPAVYDEGEAAVQGATLPYVTVGAGTQVPFHTMGPVGSARYGWNCTVQVKAVSQGTEAASLAILSQVAVALYEGRDLGLAGYATSWVEEFTVVPTLI
jgi:hypothetical protein